jgi:hypothetical protein
MEKKENRKKTERKPKENRKKTERKPKENRKKTERKRPTHCFAMQTGFNFYPPRI